MSAYQLTPLAGADLLQIWEYIAEDDISAADRVVANLLESFDLIARYPRLGRVREDWTERPVRFFVVRHYHIVYRADTAPITIVAIIHSARDAPTVLKDR